jgi:cyclin-dependent kinase 2
MQVDQAGPAPLFDAGYPLSSTRSSEKSKRYTFDCIVGSGTFGRVYKGRDLQENRAVALKEIRIDADEVGMPSTALREIALLRELDHPYIVKCVAPARMLQLTG